MGFNGVLSIALLFGAMTAQAEPARFTRFAGSAPGCVFSDPKQRNLCCEGAITAETIGTFAFGQKCAQTKGVIVPFHANPNSPRLTPESLGDPCNFQIEDQIYAGRKWTCKSSELKSGEVACLPDPQVSAPMDEKVVQPILEVAKTQTPPASEPPASEPPATPPTTAPAPVSPPPAAKKPPSTSAKPPKGIVAKMMTSPDGDLARVQPCVFLQQGSVTRATGKKLRYTFCCKEQDVGGALPNCEGAGYELRLAGVADSDTCVMNVRWDAKNQTDIGLAAVRTPSRGGGVERVGKTRGYASPRAGWVHACESK